MNIEQMARSYGLSDPYINRLNTANQFIKDSANQDRAMINSQLNQTVSDYQREQEKQNQSLQTEQRSAYIDYAKAINPYSEQRSSASRIGLGDSGFSESSLIGANNTYQNRYTDTKTNFDNIFADINNNIAKARETGNIELAKIAQSEQERMLENLWRLNEEYRAEEQQKLDNAFREAQLAEQKRQANLSAATARAKIGGGNDPIPLTGPNSAMLDSAILGGNYFWDLGLSDKAADYLATNVQKNSSNGQITLSNLETILSNGLSKGYISDQWVNKIINSLGG